MTAAMTPSGARDRALLAVGFAGALVWHRTAPI